MILNYIKLGIRNLKAQKTYTIINILGLSIGIAAFILIFLHIQYEMGFNKHIPQASSVYRCVEIQQAPGVGEQHVAVTMGPLAEALTTDFPEIEESVRLLYWGPQPLQYNDLFFDQNYVIFADTSVFSIFGIKLIRGEISSALLESNSFVPSEKVAIKLFGSVDEAMGKMIKVNNKSLLVTGVMENQPDISSFKFEALIPFEYIESTYAWLRSWGNNSMDTYVRLKPGTDLKDLESKFPAFITRKIEPDDPEDQFRLYLQPVEDIHLKSGHIKFQVMNYKQGNVTMIYAFSIVAFLIILLACVNFINLSIAQSVKRSREVGMRKVMGANRISLMNQFLGESFIITLISILFALLLAYWMLPFFNEILESSFVIDLIGNAVFSLGLIIILVVVSLLAGIYPAFYLSKLDPISVLKSGIDTKGSSSGFLTKVLVVFQFIISIAMIFSISVIYDQYKYAVNKDLGINYTNVLSIKLYDKNDDNSVSYLRNEFLNNPNIIDVSLLSDVNGVAGSQNSLIVDDSSETRIAMRLGFVDYNFFEMMDIPIIMGRNFSKDYSLDDSNAVILNRAAVDFLNIDNPLDIRFKPFTDTITQMKVIGVIEDYHYYSIHSKIEPAAYTINPSRSNVLAVKIKGDNIKETIAYLENIWSNQFPSIPFNSDMATVKLKEEYKSEESTFKIFSLFTLLSMVISCLGLYGLTALVIERKNREIGIRKVFGGSVNQIIKFILYDFVMLILIAGVIATPLAWYFMDMALQNFAYHISMGWFYFVESIILALLVAIITIIYHALKAATANPVETLRYE